MIYYISIYHVHIWSCLCYACYGFTHNSNRALQLIYCAIRSCQRPGGKRHPVDLVFDPAAADPAEAEVAPIAAAEELVEVGPADQEVPASAGTGHLVVPVVVEVVAAVAAAAAAGPSGSALAGPVPAGDVGRTNLEDLPDEDREACLVVPADCIQVVRHNSEEDSLPVGPAAAARHIRTANIALPAADPAHCRAQTPSDPPFPSPDELGR